MRLLCSTALLFVFVLCGLAQTASNKSAEPKVTVIQQKWRREIRNPALDKDPVQDMQERDRSEQRRRDTERTNEIIAERGMPSPTSTVPGARDTTRSGITVLYVYEMKLRNNGTKGIRKLMWDYVFFEKGTETELGRRRFISKININPGATSNIVVRAAAAPAATIDARRAGRKPQDQYSEKIVIQRLEYDDGSVWRPTPN
jgi:hypothetical protein